MQQDLHKEQSMTHFLSKYNEWHLTRLINLAKLTLSSKLGEPAWEKVSEHEFTMAIHPVGTSREKRICHLEDAGHSFSPGDSIAERMSFSSIRVEKLFGSFGIAIVCGTYDEAHDLAKEKGYVKLNVSEAFEAACFLREHFGDADIEERLRVRRVCVIPKRLVRRDEECGFYLCSDLHFSRLVFSPIFAFLGNEKRQAFVFRVPD